MKLKQIFGHLILAAFLSYILYQLCYPFSNFDNIGKTEIVFILLCLAGISYALIKIISTMKGKPPIRNIEKIINIKEEPKQEEKMNSVIKEIIQGNKEQEIPEMDEEIINLPNKKKNSNTDPFDNFKGLYHKGTDIAKIGENLTKEFSLSVSNMVSRIDHELDKLKKEKLEAERVWTNIHQTAEKLWKVNIQVEQTRDRLDMMIKSNEEMKSQLNNITDVS